MIGEVDIQNEINRIGYFAVIPATVLFNNELKPNEKLLYALITALSNKEGYCYASNKYLGEKLGAKIVLKALEEPAKQIAINSGLEPAVIVEKVKNEKEGIGFDAATETYVDMKKAGIVDPTKVTRSALQNAVSIASMVLTTESLVTDAPEEKCNCGGHNDGAAGMEGMY